MSQSGSFCLGTPQISPRACRPVQDQLLSFPNPLVGQGRSKPLLGVSTDAHKMNDAPSSPNMCVWFGALSQTRIDGSSGE